MIRSFIAALCVVCVTSLMLDAGDTAIPAWVTRFNSDLESLIESVARMPDSPADLTPETMEDVIVVSDSDPANADAHEPPVIIVEDNSPFCPSVFTERQRFRGDCGW